MLIFRKHSPKKLGKDNTCWLTKKSQNHYTHLFFFIHMEFYVTDRD